MSKSKKHQRSCPALGRDISSAECGSGRGSLHACPADCSYFPFTSANYDQHGEIEDRLMGKVIQRAKQLMNAPDRAQLDEHSTAVWILHHRRDADGQTFGERMLADKLSGLNNDERVVLAGMNRIRPVLLEIHRIIDAQTIEALDLLDGTPLRIIDRSLAQSVGRYCALLAWCFPMPHYERFSGISTTIPSVTELEPADILREIIRHLDGPNDAAQERAWLAEHFTRTWKAITAVKQARDEAALATVESLQERSDDLSGQIGGRKRAFNPGLVPPRLLENPVEMMFSSQRVESGTSPLEIYRKQYETFLDEPLPALGGRTPRSAATDPSLRGQLIRLMKAHVRACDAQRCKQGLDIDLNPLLAELGLHEMISTPPPLGDSLDEIDEVFATIPDFGTEEGPFEVIAPLSPEEVEDRFTAAYARYPDPADALEDMEVFFPALLDMCRDATKSTLKENGWIALELLITRTCLLLRPEPEGPEFLNMDRILAGFAREFRSAANTLSAQDKGGQVRFEHWLGNSPQPAVMDDLSGALAMICKNAPRKERPRDEEVMVIIAFLKSIVMELARERDA